MWDKTHKICHFYLNLIDNRNKIKHRTLHVFWSEYKLLGCRVKVERQFCRHTNWQALFFVNFVLSLPPLMCTKSIRRNFFTSLYSTAENFIHEASKICDKIQFRLHSTPHDDRWWNSLVSFQPLVKWRRNFFAKK